MRTLLLALVLGLPPLVLQLAGSVDETSAPSMRLVGLASLLFVLTGLLLLFRILDELFGASVAFWTSILTLYATFLFWYVVHETAVSHAVAFFVASAVLALWWPTRCHLRPGRALCLGLLLGLGAAVRPQNGLLLLLPAASLLSEVRHKAGYAVRTGLLVLGAFGVGAVPQILAGKNAFLASLLALPQGEPFLHVGHPDPLLMLFSSRHGLLYWTPVLWGGFVGFVPLLRRDRFATLALGAPLLLMSYANACSGNDGGAGTFSNGRFDSALPLLAVGLGASLEWLREDVRRRPMRVTWATGLAFVLWNQLLIVQYRERLPADDTVSLTAIAEHNAKAVSRTLGTPLAWPANWVFARAYELPSAAYDLMAGKYLFYLPNNLGGVVAVGDGRADPALFAGEWSSPAPCGMVLCREVRGRARVMAPLEVPEELDVNVRAFGQGTLTLAVNGTEMASFPLEAEPRDLRVRVPRQNWRRALNDVSLSVGAGGAAFVERLVFEHAGEATTRSRPS